MLTIEWQTQFKKDYKIVKKQQKNLEKLIHIIHELQQNNPLPLKTRATNLRAIILIAGNAILNQIGC